MWESKVALFLLCYGYLESQQRGFIFGAYEREIILAVVLIFQELLVSLFIIFWELLTSRPAPSGYTGVVKRDFWPALSYDALALLAPEHSNLRRSPPLLFLPLKIFMMF